jgi:hypothetical protein
VILVARGDGPNGKTHEIYCEDLSGEKVLDLIPPELAVALAGAGPIEDDHVFLSQLELPKIAGGSYYTYLKITSDEIISLFSYLMHGMPIQEVSRILDRKFQELERAKKSLEAKLEAEQAREKAEDAALAAELATEDSKEVDR